ATAIIIGWSFLQQQLWPVKPEGDKKPPLAKAKDAPAKDEKTDEKSPETKPDEKVAEGKKDEKTDEKKDAAPIPAPKAPETFLLGDKVSYLNVVVTNRGAGVQMLTLTKFKAA